MKQTAVEWLFEQVVNRTERVYFLKELEQAKEMFEKQVTLSHINGQSEFDKGAYEEHNQKLANNYYKQTFKSE